MEHNYFAHQIPPVDLANIAWSTTADLNQSRSLTLSGVNDGYVHAFFVRATDIMGNHNYFNFLKTLDHFS
jgi:hypothetical protein